MTQLTRHFAAHEFRCRCGKCDPVEIDLALLVILEAVREAFGRPVHINSGHRCAAHNRAVGGSPDSQHIRGTAADIVVSSVPPEDIADWLGRQPWADRIGLGRYLTFTHIDTRGYRARWRGRGAP